MARLDVTEGLAAAGSTVRFSSSQGTLSGKESPLEVPLDPGADGATQRVFFRASAVGTAMLGASVGGVNADSLEIVVAERPRFDSPPLDQTSAVEVVVRTRGILDSCLASIPYPGSANAAFDDGTPLQGITPVPGPPGDCVSFQIARIVVDFVSSPPKGAKVTLRCWDVFGQVDEVVLAPPPPSNDQSTGDPPVTGKWRGLRRRRPSEPRARVAAVEPGSLLDRWLPATFTPMSAEKIENRLPDDHPAVLAALRAPIEPEGDEEREAVEAALNSGQLVPGSMVTAEIARRARRPHG